MSDASKMYYEEQKRDWTEAVLKAAVGNKTDGCIPLIDYILEERKYDYNFNVDLVQGPHNQTPENRFAIAARLAAFKNHMDADRRAGEAYIMGGETSSSGSFDSDFEEDHYDGADNEGADGEREILKLEYRTKTDWESTPSGRRKEI